MPVGVVVKLVGGKNEVTVIVLSVADLGGGRVDGHVPIVTIVEGGHGGGPVPAIHIFCALHGGIPIVVHFVQGNAVETATAAAVVVLPITDLNGAGKDRGVPVLTVGVVGCSEDVVGLASTVCVTHAERVSIRIRVEVGAGKGSLVVVRTITVVVESRQAVLQPTWVDLRVGVVTVLAIHRGAVVLGMVRTLVRVPIRVEI